MGTDPCTITVFSPDRKERRVRISAAEMVVYAEGVLKTCAETGTGTGGANTFRGSWRVAVTRNPIEMGSWDLGGWGEG